eukprot:1216249-Prymnesium_polylepis.1
MPSWLMKTIATPRKSAMNSTIRRMGNSVKPTSVILILFARLQSNGSQVNGLSTVLRRALVTCRSSATGTADALSSLEKLRVRDVLGSTLVISIVEAAHKAKGRFVALTSRAHPPVNGATCHTTSTTGHAGRH